MCHFTTSSGTTTEDFNLGSIKLDFICPEPLGKLDELRLVSGDMKTDLGGSHFRNDLGTLV